MISINLDTDLENDLFQNMWHMLIRHVQLRQTCLISLIKAIEIIEYIIKIIDYK